MSNILGAYYVTQSYSVGQAVGIGELEGRILRTTATAVILDTPAGQVQVPASLFSERPSTLVS